MKTSKCGCGNRIYFNNRQCVACKTWLGRCDVCHALTSFSQCFPDSDSSRPGPAEASTLTQPRCDACQSHVFACANHSHGVCNSFVDTAGKLCQWCQFTTDVPDLGQPENIHRWGKLEAAKRRLLLQLDDLGFPPFVGDYQITKPLAFRFLDDVTTGHAKGVITINLDEADSVNRERLRVNLNEPHRTLIGHMRHEIGHYFDYALDHRIDREAYRALFGDPEAEDYQQALQRHYAVGPPANWTTTHVSAYATMHPWEDFAETVNVYLDIMAIATTANDQGRSYFDLTPDADAVELAPEILRIAIEVSEYNFDLGLHPLLPEKFSPSVLNKLAFVHSLRS